MPKRPARRYTAQYMDDAVAAHADAVSKAMEIAPQAFGPMSRLPVNVPAAEEIETLPGHCFTCKKPSEFEVDPTKTKTMKNGAIMKQGKCKGDGCGQTLTRFVSGKKEVSAAA